MVVLGVFWVIFDEFGGFGVVLGGFLLNCLDLGILGYFGLFYMVFVCFKVVFVLSSVMLWF